jgi:hypothetical protein
MRSFLVVTYAIGADAGLFSFGGGDEFLSQSTRDDLFRLRTSRRGNARHRSQSLMLRSGCLTAERERQELEHRRLDNAEADRAHEARILLLKHEIAKENTRRFEGERRQIIDNEFRIRRYNAELIHQAELERMKADVDIALSNDRLKAKCQDDQRDRDLRSYELERHELKLLQDKQNYDHMENMFRELTFAESHRNHHRALNTAIEGHLNHQFREGLRHEQRRFQNQFLSRDRQNQSQMIAQATMDQHHRYEETGRLYDGFFETVGEQYQSQLNFHYEHVSGPQRFAELQSQAQRMEEIAEGTQHFDFLSEGFWEGDSGECDVSSGDAGDGLKY